MDLTMYVPTKGRPLNAIRLQEQCARTCRADTKLIFILSSNDNNIGFYQNLDNMIEVSPAKPGFVDPLNLGFLRDKPTSFAVGFMGDDHFPRTVGWDELFLKELNRLGSGFVYGNDCLQGERIPTHIAMTTDIANTLGFMTLPVLKHLYADNFWLDLGKAINRITYLPDVIIEHLHPALGKAKHDAGYEFSGDSRLDSEDKARYQYYLNNEFHFDVINLKRMLRSK